MTLTWLLRFGVALAAAGFVWMMVPAQDADASYRPLVSAPAFTESSPVVAIDEGHFNVHTATGRYLPFARLLNADGFRVVRSEGRITPEALRRADVFVTANPLGLRGAVQHAANLVGLERWVRLNADAFADDELELLRDWVHRGGRLLIAADHAPAGLAARRLAALFGVESSMWWAEDQTHSDALTGVTTLVFSRSNGMLQEHPITAGRHPGERVNLVMTFTGQTLQAPPGADVILRMSPEAREYPYRVSRESSGRSAAGNAQAIALRAGAGRVVVIGEAAALTAQVARGPNDVMLDMGLNREGVDNAQFVLNVMHWLMGLLD